MTDDVHTSARKQFGLVVAVHDVAKYLPEFITSVEAQTHPLDDLSIVAVDDGSTDGSLALLEAWRARRPELVTVITRPSGGPGAARNAGLDVIDCAWVTFPDPDDALEPDYFANVSQMIEAQQNVVLLATNRRTWTEATGEVQDTHPHRRMFEPRDQVKNLDEFPEYFHTSASASFLKLDLLNEHGLRFDERIRPTFEGGHLVQRYLLRTQPPTVAFVKSAGYRFRKRHDQSSLTDQSATTPSQFLAVPLHGYLELLQEAVRLRGHVPEWLQNVVIDELTAALRLDEYARSASACTGEVARQFIDILSRVRAMVDDEVIRGFNARGLKARWRQVLLYGLSPEPWHTPYVMLRRYDAANDQILVSYRYTGPEPAFEATLRGKAVQPVASKVRDYRYWDHTVMHERLIWIPANGTLRIWLNHRLVGLRNTSNDFVRTAWRPSQLRHLSGADPLAEPVRRASVRERWHLAGSRLTSWIATSSLVRKRYGGAWVLMDRVSNTGDNGLRLFEHLRENRPDINAWFVLHRDSSDWDAVAKQTNRLVAYGSWRWQLLMLNCHNLISSHVDHLITRPAKFVEPGQRPPWNFVFLQHGVIKNDISGWLNKVPIDLFITSSPGEHESIVGDGTSYMFTDKEVKMTGLARFDRLLAIGQTVPEDRQRIILVAPTWRNWLKTPRVPGEDRRPVVAHFLETEYAHNWLGLLTSPRVASLCRDEGLRIGFLPHPEFETILPTLDLPAHVDALRYSNRDVQELFAEAAVMVTDYSSVAFNSAYIDRPVVYFQFDKDLMDAGAHLGTPGYFDYERDGFGPVAYSLEEAEDAVVKTLLAGRRTQAPFDDRIRSTFANRDGKCCSRTVTAIEQLL